MSGWKNFQPDDFQDKDSAPGPSPLSMDVRKRKTPDSGTHDTHKRFRLPDECGSAESNNLVETLRPPEHANYSVSNTNKTLRLSEQGWRDEKVRLQAEVHLLKELIELKDGQIQEWAVRSKGDQVKWLEEGCRLAEENSALRNEVCTLKKDVLCLEHKADELKRANDDLLNRIADSRKYYVSEGIQADTSDESSNVRHLKEEIRTLHAENNDLRSEFRLCLEGNHALAEDVTRLHTVVTSKDEIIDAWEKRGEEWKSWKTGFQREVDMLQRTSKDNVRRLMDENQRPHEIGASEASQTTNSATDNNVLKTPQNSFAISNPVLDDQTDRNETTGTNIASTDFDPVEPPSSLPGTSVEERTDLIVAAEGASMISSPNALNHEFSDSLVMTPGHDVDDTGGIPLKRKRGRPKGSKNKNPSLASIRAALNSGVPKRKPGRPPKERKPPALGPDGEPLPKRKPGRPRKFRKPYDTHTMKKTQGSNSVQSNLTHPVEIGEPSGSNTPYDLPFENLIPNGDPAPHDIADGQVPLPIKETILDAEISAPLDQNGEVTLSQMEVESHNPDGGGMIKVEHSLTERHLELIYHTENGKLFCILCERTRAPGTPIVSFHTGTPHQKLFEHCNIHHPHECAKFVLMSPEKLADMRDRYIGSMPVNSQIIERT